MLLRRDIIRRDEALCLSHIQYMSLIWGNANAKNLKPVNKCIKSVARFVLEKQKYDSIKQEMTEKLGWLLPNFLYNFRSLCFIKQFSYHMTPTYFNNLFNLKLVDSRNGMLSKTNVQFKNKFSDRTIESVSVKHFNALSIELRNDDLIPCFKSKLFDHMLVSKTIKFFFFLIKH